MTVEQAINELKDWQVAFSHMDKDMSYAIEALDMAIEALSSQPEIKTDGDTISRQDAISIPFTQKGLRKYQTCNLDDAYNEGWWDYQACVSQLPSAQSKQRWIPVSERLPKGLMVKVLVSAIDSDGLPIIPHVATYDGFTKTWSSSLEIANVEAWQPLPEPYREEENVTVNRIC